MVIEARSLTMSRSIDALPEARYLWGYLGRVGEVPGDGLGEVQAGEKHL